MKHLVLTALLSLPLISATSAAADVDHFTGKTAKDLKSALCNLDKYNQRLAQLVNKKRLKLEDLAEIHQLTYTLEVAVQKTQQELNVIAEELEFVHKGSEHANFDKVKKSGAKYLAKTQLLTQGTSCK